MRCHFYTRWSQEGGTLAQGERPQTTAATATATATGTANATTEINRKSREISRRSLENQQKINRDH